MQDGTYHGVKLSDADVKLLAGPEFINDGTVVTFTGCKSALHFTYSFETPDIIGFYFQYLQHERFGKNDGVLFVTPAVAHLITLVQCTGFCALQLFSTISYALLLELAMKDLEDNVKDLKLDSRSLVLFPLNNNMDVEHQGGMHWYAALPSLWSHG